MKACIFFFLSLTTAILGNIPNKPIGFIAIKPSYFYPQDSSCRHLYKGGFLPLGEIGFYLPSHFFLSLEGGYFHKKKQIQSFDIRSSSTLTQVPISLCVGYIYPLRSYLDIYLKIGPNGIYTRTAVSIPNLASEKKKYTFGFTLATGTKFYLYKGLYTEIFCNYLYNRKKIHSSNDSFFVYLGGLQIGGSLGYRF
ncbi:MAG: outer membrane beta-barrel protein [Chlamydiota bacterium]